MPPIPLIHPSVLTRHGYEDLAGVDLRMHLMDRHGWSVAMVLTWRTDESYLQDWHRHAHE